MLVGKLGGAVERGDREDGGEEWWRGGVVDCGEGGVGVGREEYTHGTVSVEKERWYM